jgi:hypothetical protein
MGYGRLCCATTGMATWFPGERNLETLEIVLYELNLKDIKHRSKEIKKEPLKHVFIKHHTVYKIQKNTECGLVCG